MSCGNSKSSKCNPCGPSEAAVNAIADRAAYYARIAVEAANSACFQLQEDGNRRWAYIGDGIQTIFDIPGAGTTISASYIVGIDGVLQDPDNYTVQQTHPSNPYTLTMSVPVPAGSEIVIVSIKGITGATGPIGPIGPSGGPTGATGLPSPAGGIRWAFTSDGSNVFYTLPGAFSTLNTAYLVTYDGVTQDPNNYIINSGSPYSITLSTAPANGVGIVIVSLNGIQGPTGATGPSGGPTGATGPSSPAGGIRWAYTSDGSNTLYPLLGALSTLNTAYLVTFNGVTQDPNNYTIAAGSPYSITLSTAPAAGVGIVIVSLNGIQGATGQQGTPGGATGATGPAGTNGTNGAVGPAFPAGGLRWAYTGNGSQTVFNIAGASTTLGTAYLVAVDGITQDSANYTITAGSPYTLTISTVPNGSVIVITSLTAGLANWITGFGSPNGVVTAPTGSVYTNLTGGSLSTLYVKESGSGNTGWIAK